MGGFERLGPGSVVGVISTWTERVFKRKHALQNEASSFRHNELYQTGRQLMKDAVQFLETDQYEGLKVSSFNASLLAILC